MPSLQRLAIYRHVWQGFTAFLFDVSLLGEGATQLT
jgi:hypothetical protein